MGMKEAVQMRIHLSDCMGVADAKSLVGLVALSSVKRQACAGPMTVVAQVVGEPRLIKPSCLEHGPRSCRSHPGDHRRWLQGSGMENPRTAPVPMESLWTAVPAPADSGQKRPSASLSTAFPQDPRTHRPYGPAHRLSTPSAFGG